MTAGSYTKCQLLKVEAFESWNNKYLIARLSHSGHFKSTQTHRRLWNSTILLDNYFISIRFKSKLSWRVWNFHVDRAFLFFAVGILKASLLCIVITCDFILLWIPLFTRLFRLFTLFMPMISRSRSRTSGFSVFRSGATSSAWSWPSLAVTRPWPSVTRPWPSYSRSRSSVPRSGPTSFSRTWARSSPISWSWSSPGFGPPPLTGPTFRSWFTSFFFAIFAIFDLWFFLFHSVGFNLHFVFFNLFWFSFDFIFLFFRFYLFFGFRFRFFPWPRTFPRFGTSTPWARPRPSPSRPWPTSAMSRSRPLAPTSTAWPTIIISWSRWRSCSWTSYSAFYTKPFF